MPGFYNSGSRGTIVGKGDDEFDPEDASKQLREAMSGLGTNEAIIIDVVTAHNYEQRQIIRDKFKTMYGQDVDKDLESELGGTFAKVITGLMQDPEEYLMEQVNSAIKGIGTNERKLVSLLCCRTNDELTEMKEAYKNKYGSEMEEDVTDDLSGDVRTLMVSLINAGRDESEAIDPDKVREDAQALFDAGPGQVGTKEEVYNAIFNCRSPAHMREVFDMYEEVAEGKTIEETIDSEFDGSVQAAYTAMIKSFRNMVAYNAERLHDATSGVGTDDDTLIEILVTRSEIDLRDILEFYEGKYGKPLVDVVASETSGDYRKTLTRILGEEVSDNE
ncbi:unnamed protein product [Allacma fusca]|uniref:Annexin n=1 Tax=Allacma fusca TaxID=39272 RepID=A0A8J2PND9_9HEXA|nr:unnamed protein product [Allacma fusca]